MGSRRGAPRPPAPEEVDESGTWGSEGVDEARQTHGNQRRWMVQDHDNQRRWIRLIRIDGGG
eukprot:1681932-Lingulodinium_polyedra.AAC.1